MKSNKTQQVASMTTRQKITAVLVVIVIVVIFWQIIGFFRGNTVTPPAANKEAASSVAMQQTMPMPKPALLPKQPVLAPQEDAALVALQQATQARYVQALNDLQMLRLQRDKAQTDQAIAAAQLATVTAQKSIVDLLAPTQPLLTGASYGPNLANPAGATTQATPPQPPPAPISYTVISVTQIEGRWAAVLGYQGNLYSIHVGDILPPDRSTVLDIDRGGVVLLDQNKVRRRVSLVPVI